MASTHIEALTECIENPNVSADCKTHLSAILAQMEAHKADRKPTKRGAENIAMKNVLNTNLNAGKAYTAEQMSNILTTNGFTTTPHRTIGLALDIGLKQDGVIINTDGKKVPLYKR